MLNKADFLKHFNLGLNGTRKDKKNCPLSLTINIKLIYIPVNSRLMIPNTPQMLIFHFTLLLHYSLTAGSNL